MEIKRTLYSKILDMTIIASLLVMWSIIMSTHFIKSLVITIWISSIGAILIMEKFYFLVYPLKLRKKMKEYLFTN
ncbi:hypothetical protein JOC73_001663 [Alkaliphilus hydrothermalis]|uniref:Uncharacterized protein n=1 Tax=Alkaliphilus hydrothermalis TaxID=1482730 RepID=A0ABS2NQA6_9FIRM|nr:hypothetical protein [Alkaliphilus hydrothermalis]